MNNKKSFFFVTAVACCILGSIWFAINSCKKPTDGVNLVLNTNLINTTIGISFIDAKTGEPVGYSGTLKVTMSISGQNASSVMDIIGTSDYKTDKGFSNLALDPQVKPSSSNPVTFNIVALSLIHI